MMRPCPDFLFPKCLDPRVKKIIASGNSSSITLFFQNERKVFNPASFLVSIPSPPFLCRSLLGVSAAASNGCSVFPQRVAQVHTRRVCIDRPPTPWLPCFLGRKKERKNLSWQVFEILFVSVSTGALPTLPSFCLALQSFEWMPIQNVISPSHGERRG